MAKQANAQKAISDLTSAIQGATNLLETLKSVAAPATVQPAPASNKSQGSQGSAGRLPSEAQQKVRDAIEAEMKADKIGLFTIKGLTDRLGLDRIQVRNAVGYFEAQGTVVRWAEKLPEGRGQRELVYKVASFAAAF